MIIQQVLTLAYAMFCH